MLLICLFAPVLAYASCETIVDGLCQDDVDIVVYQGTSSSPSTSLTGEARIYFDSGTGKLQCSEDGNSYVDCVDNGSGSLTLQNVTDNGATTDNDITIDNGGLSDNNLNLNGSTHSQLTSTATDLFQIEHPTGTKRLTINSSGNAGIGITEPDGKLHVHTGNAGSVTAEGEADDLVVENSTSGGISILAPDSSNSNIRFGSPTTNSGALVRWNYNAGQMTIGTNKADGITHFMSGAFSESMRIDSSGNVGIGSTSPMVKLDIAGGSNVKSRARITNTSNSQILQLSTNSDSISNPFVGSESDHNFSLISNNTEALTIDSSGNVGIADTTPDATLEIVESGTTPFMISNGASGDGDFFTVTTAGNVGIGSTAPSSLLDVTGSSPKIVVNATSGLPEVQLTDGGVDEFAMGYDTGSNFLYFSEGGVGNHMTIRDGGNVGLGTNLPSADLELRSDAATSHTIFKITSATNNAYDPAIQFYKGATPAAQWAIGNDGSTNDFSIAEGSALGTNDRLVIKDSSGNVGIGTNSPQHELDIAGDVIISGQQHGFLETLDKTLEDPADADSFLIYKAPAALTITDIDCIVDPADTGESVVIDIQECDGTGDSCTTVDATITCDNDGAADDGSLSNGAIDSGDWINWDIGTVTGTVTQVSVTVKYELD